MVEGRKQTAIRDDWDWMADLSTVSLFLVDHWLSLRWMAGVVSGYSGQIISAESLRQGFIKLRDSGSPVCSFPFLFLHDYIIRLFDAHPITSTFSSTATSKKEPLQPPPANSVYSSIHRHGPSIILHLHLHLHYHLLLLLSRLLSSRLPFETWYRESWRFQPPELPAPPPITMTPTISSPTIGSPPTIAFLHLDKSSMEQ